MSHWIFKNLHEIRWFKTIKAEFFRKILILEKKLKKITKYIYIFLASLKNQFQMHWFAILIPKIVHNNVHYNSAKSTCQWNIWFSSYSLKCLKQLDCSILWSSISLEEINWCLRFSADNQRKKRSETATFCCVASCVSCPIRLQGPFIINISGKSQMKL